MKAEKLISWMIRLILKMIKLFMSIPEIPIEIKKMAALEIAATSVDLATGADLDEGINLFEDVLNEIQNRRDIIKR